MRLPVLAVLLLASLGFAAEPTTPAKTVPLFDGQTLTGWTFVSKDPAIDAASLWSVKNGTIACTGKPNGYARTNTTFRDFALHFEWRWPGPTGGNSGVFVHLSGEDKVWPACLEVQLKAGDAGSVRANGGTKVRELNPAAKDPINVARRTPGTEKPIGEWNSCDVECRGATIRIHINGVLQNEVTGASVSAGAIALQAEGTAVEFRNLTVGPLH